MTIKHLGGIFGRNPTFEEVVVDDEITANKGNFVLNDAATNTVSYPLDVHHTTTGSATNGFGVGINFNLENTVYGITDDAAKIEVVSVSPAEIADNLVFKTKWNATLADRLVLRGRGGVAGVVDLDLIYGNLKVADGFGIDFSLTSGTGTSELFDDYEEGTWTPLISQDGNGVVNFTTVSQSGTYTKIGNIVIANFVYEYSSIGSVGNNFAFLSGLPFTSANNSVDEQSFAFFQQTAFDTKTYSSRKLNNNAKVAFQYDNGEGTLYVGAPFMVGNTYPGAATVRGKCIYIAA